MEVALFCWRPYHIFNAINIVSNDVEHSSGNTTLFLFDYSVLTQSLDRLISSCLFKDIVIVNNNNESGDHVKKFVGQIRSKFCASRTINGEKKNYTDFFDTILASSFNIDLLEMVDINKRARICIFEDGINSYCSDSNFGHLNPKFHFIRKLLGKKLNTIEVNAKYFYAPEMVTYLSDSEFFELPKINTETFELEKEAFDYKYEVIKDIYNKKNIIYLDQNFESDKLSFIENILNKRYSKVILRAHPNDPASFDSFDEDTSGQSWEILCKDVVNDDTIIISPSSMALFTPYILYKKKPTIIVLSKLLINPEDMDLEIFDVFCRHFVKTLEYSNLYIPESLENFENILESQLEG